MSKSSRSSGSSVPPALMRAGCISAPLIMIVGGALTFHWLVIGPATRSFKARNWPAVECRILESKVVRFDAPNTIEDGVTWFIDIDYSYTFEGKQFRSKRVDFLNDTSSGGRGSKDEFVARHPAGSTRICYVNPEDPRQAVINRGLPGRMWWGLLPLACLLAGLVALPLSFFSA